MNSANTVRELSFDTAAKGSTMEPGVPYAYDDADIGQELYVRVSIKGRFALRVTKPESFDMLGAERYDDHALSTFVGALGTVVAADSKRLGAPEQLPQHADELLQPVRERLSGFWGGSLGAELMWIKIDSAGRSERDRAFLEEMLRRKDIGKKLAGMTREELERWAMTPEKVRLEAAGKAPEARAVQHSGSSWTCSCGTRNSGRFCTECGAKREWKCSCGQLNDGNFCTECGKKRV